MPVPLTSPLLVNQTDHASVHIASEMAYAHNSMLRGINSIYLQAPHVRPGPDTADFLFFVKAWARWVREHHELEETRMFPAFEAIAGKSDLLRGNVDQHHAFAGGLEQLHDYAERGGVLYRAAELTGIVDGFAPALTEHLHDEIGTLLALRPYDGDGLLAAYKESEAAAGQKDDESKVRGSASVCDGLSR